MIDYLGFKTSWWRRLLLRWCVTVSQWTFFVTHIVQTAVVYKEIRKNAKLAGAAESNTVERRTKMGR